MSTKTYTRGRDSNNVAKAPRFADLEKVRGDIQEKVSIFRQAADKLNEMLSAHNMYMSTLTEALKYGGTMDAKDEKKFMDSVDSRLWDMAITAANVGRVLSADGETKLRKHYQEKPPVFTALDATHVVERLGENAGMLAGKTVREVFDKLIGSTFRRGGNWRAEKEHRNPDKVRTSFRFSHFGSLVDHYHSRESFDLFNDLEAVCCLVNDVRRPEYPNRIGDKMQNENGRYNDRVWNFSTQWFKIELFKCGNVKVDFTCKETLNRLNRYGGADGSRLGMEVGAAS